MLEMLLMMYKDQFGEDFPLEMFTENAEIEVINILYDCVQNNRPCRGYRKIENRFADAPGQKK